MVVLDSGRCEPLKATVHGVLLATAAVCLAYNTAAWLKRRQPHLAVNAIVYGAAILWEKRLIAHHLAACEPEATVNPPPNEPELDLSDAA
jgi:hypothetical protein